MSLVDYLIVISSINYCLQIHYIISYKYKLYFNQMGACTLHFALCTVRLVPRRPFRLSALVTFTNACYVHLKRTNKTNHPQHILHKEKLTLKELHHHKCWTNTKNFP